MRSDEKQKIQNLYDNGLSVRDICKQLNMSSKTFYKLGIKTRSIAKANKLYSANNPQKHTKETREKLSKIRSEALRHNAFYSKRQEYNGIMLDSSYEIKVAKSLDENNVKWIRPKGIHWDDNGQLRIYLPDFYLPEHDVYLDPKNDYLIMKDERKIDLARKYNSVKIVVLDKHNLDWENIKKLINQ